MSLDLISLIIVSTLFVATNAFWAMLTLKLVNKLMSRSYFEYVQAEALSKPQPVSAHVENSESIDPTDLRQAQDMNSLIGVV
jgi:hypothetical protein